MDTQNDATGTDNSGDGADTTAAATPPVAPAPAAQASDAPREDGDDVNSNAEILPPATNDQGFALLDAYPLNLRLRAEALVKDGKETDDAGLVSDDDIAATKVRLDAEEAERHPAVNKRMKRAEVVGIAQAEGIEVADDDTVSTIVDKIEAARAA